jgi:hypothetical protein
VEYEKFENDGEKYRSVDCQARPSGFFTLQAEGEKCLAAETEYLRRVRLFS